MNNVEYIKQKLEHQLNIYVFSDKEIETAISKVSGFRQEDKFVFGTAKNVGVNFFLATQIDEPDILSELFEKHEVKDWNQIRQITNKIKLFVFMNNPTEEYIEKEFNRILRDYPFYKFDSSKVENYVDYRLKENLHDLVYTNILSRSLCGDTDHYHDCWVGAEYLNLDNEQKAWYALLFGYTYRAQFASLAVQLWPYPHKENIHDIAHWCSQIYDEETDKFSKMEPGTGPDNYNLIIVGKDCKYSKNTFPKFFKSVIDYSEGGNLYEKLKKAATVSEDPNVNYKSLSMEVRNNFQGIGRFMAFLVLQQLYEFFDWPINGNLCDLNEEGTWSCRTGQIAVLHGLDSITEEEIIQKGKNKPDEEFSKLMEEETKDVLEYCNSKLPFLTNVFEYESVICEITDKYALKGREFSGWTSTEKSELVFESYNLWKNHFKPTKAYPTCPDLKVLFIPQIAKRPGFIPFGWLDPNWMKTLNHTGMSTLSQYLLKDQPDVYSILSLGNPYDIQNEESKSLVESLFTKKEIDSIKVKYDPRRYIRWKKHPQQWEGFNLLVNEEQEWIQNQLPQANLVHQQI